MPGDPATGAIRHICRAPAGEGRNHRVVRIVPFKPRHAPGFFVLNRRWIAEYDLFEAPHADELSDPSERIIARGGRIYVAERRGLVAGTCAVASGLHDEMEIRWLAVDPEWRRLGIGRRLLTRCAGYARRRGVHRLVVSTSSKLAAGLRLYREFGFVEAPAPAGTRPAIADVYMELELKPIVESLRLVSRF